MSQPERKAERQTERQTVGEDGKDTQVYIVLVGGRGRGRKEN